MNTVLKNLQTQVHHLRGLENTLLFFSLAPAAFSLFTKHLAAFANIPRVFPASSISSALTRTLPMPAGCFPSSSGDVQVLVTHRKEVCCTGRDLGACWWSCVVLTTYPVQAVDRSESCPVLWSTSHYIACKEIMRLWNWIIVQFWDAIHCDFVVSTNANAFGRLDSSQLQMPGLKTAPSQLFLLLLIYQALCWPSYVDGRFSALSITSNILKHFRKLTGYLCCLNVFNGRCIEKDDV